MKYFRNFAMKTELLVFIFSLTLITIVLVPTRLRPGITDGNMLPVSSESIEIERAIAEFSMRVDELERLRANLDVIPNIELYNYEITMKRKTVLYLLRDLYTVEMVSEAYQSIIDELYQLGTRLLEYDNPCDVALFANIIANYMLNVINE